MSHLNEVHAQDDCVPADITDMGMQRCTVCLIFVIRLDLHTRIECEMTRNKPHPSKNPHRVRTVNRKCAVTPSPDKIMPSDSEKRERSPKLATGETPSYAMVAKRGASKDENTTRKAWEAEKLTYSPPMSPPSFPDEPLVHTPGNKGDGRTTQLKNQVTSHKAPPPASKGEGKQGDMASLGRELKGVPKERRSPPPASKGEGKITQHKDPPRNKKGWMAQRKNQVTTARAPPPASKGEGKQNMTSIDRQQRRDLTKEKQSPPPASKGEGKLTQRNNQSPPPGSKDEGKKQDKLKDQATEKSPPPASKGEGKQKGAISNRQRYDLTKKGHSPPPERKGQGTSTQRKDQLLPGSLEEGKRQGKVQDPPVRKGEENQRDTTSVNEQRRCDLTKQRQSPPPASKGEGKLTIRKDQSPLGGKEKGKTRGKGQTSEKSPPPVSRGEERRKDTPSIDGQPSCGLTKEKQSPPCK